MLENQPLIFVGYGDWPRMRELVAAMRDPRLGHLAHRGRRAGGAARAPRALALAAEHPLGCEALATAGPKAAAYAPRLRELARAGPSHLRASAVQALGCVGASGATELCVQLALEAPPEVREAAVVALGRLATGGAVEPVRHALALALDDPEPFVREAAALAPCCTRRENATYNV